MNPGSKQTSEKSVPAMNGMSKDSSSGSGPTGSRNDYAKKGQAAAAPSMDASKFNPMNDGKNTYAVGGI